MINIINKSIIIESNGTKESKIKLERKTNKNFNFN